MSRTIRTLCLLAALAVATHVVAADDAKPKDDDAKKMAAAPDAATIDGWVKQLDHAQLTKRDEAQRDLLKAGKAAIPALAKAAMSDRKETIEKSIAVLGKLKQSDDEATRQAAKGTLQMLSQCNQPSTAERAKVALDAKQDDGIKPFEGFDKPNFPLAGGGGGGNRSVSVSNSNGRRTITVKDDDIETTLQDLRGGKIQVRITGGKDKVDLIANDLNDLKKKAPEAHALYTQYAGNAGGGAGGAAFGGNGNVPAGRADEMMVKQLEQLKEQFKSNPGMLKMIDEQIKSLKKR